MSKTERVTVQKKLINVRILGHFLAVAPSDLAKRHIALATVSCKSDEELTSLGEFYDKHFIRTCKPHSFLCEIDYLSHYSSQGQGFNACGLLPPLQALF